MMTDAGAYSRYLPTSPDAEHWGLYVTDCGWTRIPPYSRYPPGEHPPDYALDRERGRVLREYQIVYITRGSGRFQSGGARRRAVAPGTVFLLFPGVRHWYYPSDNKGWDEFWVGFNGTYARQLMHPPFFSPAAPMLRVGLHTSLVERFLEVAALTETEPPGFRHLAAAATTGILAQVHALSQRPQGADRKDDERRIRDACCRMLGQASEAVDFRELAAGLGMSYSSFRRAFRRHTGLPPHQYLLRLRLHKAQTLLSRSRMPVQEIAETAGFQSAYYFSRIFKARTGMTPGEWRRAHG